MILMLDAIRLLTAALILSQPTAQGPIWEKELPTCSCLSIPPEKFLYEMRASRPYVYQQVNW